MPRTSSSLRTHSATRLESLERERPEWHAWFGLLREVERALHESDWWELPASHEPVAASPGPAPLLHGRTLEVDGGRLRRLLARLLTIASGLEGGQSLQRYRPTTEETLALIGAAVRQDPGASAAISEVNGLNAEALDSVAQLAALPLLRSCGLALRERVPSYWPHGYCPVCGAWPLVEERRGLDRSRRLRCGRCAQEWEAEWLICIYCGERNHRNLGSLVLDDGELLKVETCASCHGYLKSSATLTAIPDSELLLRDLETLELDLVALERGYIRPRENGFSLEVTLA